MFQGIVCGHLGADAKVQNYQGNEFISFRVAHTDRWKDDDGKEHSETIWVDCTMNGKPAVFEYLKKGTQVIVIGSERLRVFSSEKERRMKAGAQLSVRTVELVGGRADAVPSRLYDQNGVQHDVTKYYYTDVVDTILLSQGGQHFTTDQNGWITEIIQEGDSSQEQPANDGK